MSSEEVVQTAKEFYEVAFPSYEIVQTLDVDLDPDVWHTIEFLVEAPDGSQKQAYINVEESGGDLDVIDVDMTDRETSGGADEEDESVDNPVEKARQFFSTSYPTYEVVRTLDVDLDSDLWHTVELLVEAEDGTRNQAYINVEESGSEFEVTDVDLVEAE